MYWSWSLNYIHFFNLVVPAGPCIGRGRNLNGSFWPHFWILVRGFSGSEFWKYCKKLCVWQEIEKSINIFVKSCENNYCITALNRIDGKISKIRALNNKILLMFELLDFAYFLSYSTPATFLWRGSNLNLNRLGAGCRAPPPWYFFSLFFKISVDYK